MLGTVTGRLVKSTLKNSHLGWDLKEEKARKSPAGRGTGAKAVGRTGWRGQEEPSVRRRSIMSTVPRQDFEPIGQILSQSSSSPSVLCDVEKVNLLTVP